MFQIKLNIAIYIILFTLIFIRFAGSVVDGMSIGKSDWLVWHLFNSARRDVVIGATYLYLWECRLNNSDFLAIPLCYAISLNWSLHVIGYWLGDAISSYQRFVVGGLTLAMGIGSALFILAGLYLSAVFMKDFYATFGIGLLVGFVWSVAYRIAYRGYGVIR